MFVLGRYVLLTGSAGFEFFGLSILLMTGAGHLHIVLDKQYLVIDLL